MKHYFASIYFATDVAPETLERELGWRIESLQPEPKIQVEDVHVEPALHPVDLEMDRERAEIEQ